MRKYSFKVLSINSGSSDSQKAAFAYILANLLSKGINFITIPLFTSLLSTSEMGVTTTYASLQTILYSIASLGVVSGSFNVAMMTFENERDRYTSCCLVLTTLSSIVFAVVGIVVSPFWSKLTTLPDSLLWVLIMYLLLQPALDLWYARKRYENKYISVATVSVISTVTASLASLMCVWNLRANDGVNLGVVKCISQNTVMFVFAAIIYVSILRCGKCIYNKRMWHFALSLSWPLIIHALSKNILDISDRLMITKICGQSESGIYGTLFTISMMASIVWISINNALVPEMFEMLKHGNIRDMQTKIYSLLIFFGWASVIVTMLAPEILRLLTTAEYYNAVKLMPLLFSSVFLSSMYNIYGNLLLYKKKTFSIMIATSIAALINVVTNYYFINEFGYYAAACTTLLSSVFLVVLQGVMAWKTYKECMVSTTVMTGIGALYTVMCLCGVFLYDMFILRYLFVLVVFLIGIVYVMHKLSRNCN